MADKRPSLIMLENVTGFLTSKGGKDFRRAVLALAELGYWLDAFIVDARLFIPQSRPRLFVIGVHNCVKSPLIIKEIWPFFYRPIGRTRSSRPVNFARQISSASWKRPNYRQAGLRSRCACPKEWNTTYWRSSIWMTSRIGGMLMTPQHYQMFHDYHRMGQLMSLSRTARRLLAPFIGELATVWCVPRFDSTASRVASGQRRAAFCPSDSMRC